MIELLSDALNPTLARLPAATGAMEGAAEAALSYMSDRRAAEWWEALDATSDAWRDAYS